MLHLVHQTDRHELWITVNNKFSLLEHDPGCYVEWCILMRSWTEERITVLNEALFHQESMTLDLQSCELA